jgi:hypothetical protein
MSKLADHFGVKVETEAGADASGAIGRAKGDITAGTHVPPHELLQRIIDAGHTPAEIAAAIDEGKHLQSVSGGSQGADAEGAFKPVDHDEYAKAVKENPQSATLTDPAETTNNKTFSNGKGVYYSISPEGDLQGVINNSGEKGALKSVMPLPTEQRHSMRGIFTFPSSMRSMASSALRVYPTIQRRTVNLLRR